MSNELVLVIDFFNMFHRAYHVAPPLSYNDRATGATLLFYKMLRRLHESIPHPIIFAMEGGNSYRKDLSASYKANRDEITDASFGDQLVDIIQMLKNGGATMWKVEGYEADDLIASYAKNNPCIIYTNDKDMQALLKPGVSIMRNEKGGFLKEITEATFAEEYGFNPSLWQVYKALVGDPSDNIKGISGFGNIKAQKAVQYYGDDINRMKKSGYGKHFDNLRTNWDTFLTNLDLVTLKDDADLSEEAKHIRWNDMNIFLKSLGFSGTQFSV